MRQKGYRFLISKLGAEQKGEIILITLAFMLLGFILVVPLVSYMGTGLKSGMEYDTKAQDLYSADAGIEDAIWQIKYEHLDSSLSDPSNYDKFDFSTEWTYTMPEQANGSETDITIQNVWVPYGISTPATATARGIANEPRLMVTGGMVSGTTDEYHILITYYPETGESLAIDSMGIWLPPGFSYNSGSSNFEQAEGEDYYSVPGTPVKHKGGQAIVWDFASVPILSFPDVDTLDSPMTVDLTFAFTAEKSGSRPDAVSWIETSGVEDFPYCWDYDVRVFKIVSESGGTEIETYLAKSEIRKMSGSLAGDYYATGNSLMRDAYYDYGHIRDTWLDPVNHSSSVSFNEIPEDSTIAAAYLYWTGWKSEANITQVDPLDPENCSNFDSWEETDTVWGTGSESSDSFFQATDNTLSRDLSLSSNIDLSAYSGSRVAVCWDQKILRPVDLQVFYDDCSSTTNWTAGDAWSVYNEEFRGHYTGSDTQYTERTIELTNPVDLSPYSAETVKISWSQDEGGTLEYYDELHFSVYRADTGWSSYIRAFRDDDPASSYTYTIPADYLTGQFKIKFYIKGFTDSYEYCYVDDVKIFRVITPVYSGDDGLDFSIYNPDTGWSPYIQAFRGDIGTSWTDYFYFLPPQYVSTSFNIRFHLAGCSDAGEFACIDNIVLKVTTADTSVFLNINGQRVYFLNNLPEAGTDEEITADTFDTLLNLTSSYSGTVYKGFSYACFKDVTELVRYFSNGADPEGDPPAFGDGNGSYTLGGVDATLGIDGGDYQLAHAGWSLIIIYNNPETYGHQLFLYDRFSYCDDYTDLDFDQSSSPGPGGNISGFVIPSKLEGEGDSDVAAKITCFVGEGDNWLYPDFIALNAPAGYWDGTLDPEDIPNTYKLFDGQSSALSNTSSAPNNVWNGLSATCSADGIDVDTFEITWGRGLISEVDTTAHIDIYTDSGNWNLVYIILSFRSEVTIGGSLTYLIRG